MAQNHPTRRLVIITSLGGVVFGAAMATLIPGPTRDLAVGLRVALGLVIGIGFAAVTFVTFYFGFIRPRQLDPDPPEVAHRKITAHERIWGDGRPMPEAMRVLSYVGAVMFLLLGGANLVLALTGTAQTWQALTGGFLVLLSVLSFVSARRGRHARPPYSDWMDKSAASSRPPDR